MSEAGRITDLFTQDVTRDIPPVVYFQEQSPDKILSEVNEYIITGGWERDHPNHRRVPDGIHEQYVRLLSAIARELDKPGGADLPTVWISGFYGSGKSSFAKLLGLALDGVALPDGRSMAEALLARDTSPRAEELRAAWARLRQKIDPFAVIFDLGGSARHDEHLHSITLRQIQAKLGYSSKSAYIAFGELEIERDGRWERFLSLAQETFGEPWAALKDGAMATARFGKLMRRLYPETFESERSWLKQYGKGKANTYSPEEAVKLIQEMLGRRRPGATLFLVVDEVSQFVISSKDRVDRLRAFATALGVGLRGKVWLLALGQQKLDEGASSDFLVWAKDRFPPRLRVHLDTTNIRDVVHRRLLQKTPAGEAQLRALFERHRADLKLFAYDCEGITPDEFVEVYPLLPGHIDLLMQLTNAMRARQSRAQGDAHAIRGLLQLLGELFRGQGLAEQEVGGLITLEQIYEVQRTALDVEAQRSMERLLHKCQGDETGLKVKVAKAVALLELIQETMPTTAQLVARCLFGHVAEGNQQEKIEAALKALKRENLLGYANKTGYKLQSSAAEEWERERRDIAVSREQISDLIRGGLELLLDRPSKPKLHGRAFPIVGFFSDGRGEARRLRRSSDAAVVPVALYNVSADERRDKAGWVQRSGEESHANRGLSWVIGEREALRGRCRELRRSQRMVERYKPRREALDHAHKLLLTQEENRAEDLVNLVSAAIDAAWMSGKMYFSGRVILPSERGNSFATALEKVAEEALRELFDQFTPIRISPKELKQLMQERLSGPSAKFFKEGLGILEVDAGSTVSTCAGVIPSRVLGQIEEMGSATGAELIAHFSGPPYGYTNEVIKACALGLLRGSKITAHPEGAREEITAVRDMGAVDLFEKDRAFKGATFAPVGEDPVGFKARAKICKFFRRTLGVALDRDDNAIADAVAEHFPQQLTRLRSVRSRLNQLPMGPKIPSELSKLGEVLEACVASARKTRPTVLLVKKHLDALRDGLEKVRAYDPELKPEALRAIHDAARVLKGELAQLASLDANVDDLKLLAGEVRQQLERVEPWREINQLAPSLKRARAAYRAERQKLMDRQGEALQGIREQVKAREGFSTLTGEQSHAALRPLALALTDTTPAPPPPPLAPPHPPWWAGWRRAEEEAHEKLDEILSGGGGGGEDDPTPPPPPIIVLRLSTLLRNRELKRPEELERLLAEIRDRVSPYLQDEKRVRLI